MRHRDSRRSIRILRLDVYQQGQTTAQMNIYRPPVDLPVGQQPGWELEDDENAEKLKAVSER